MSIVVCFANVATNLLAFCAIRFKRHALLLPWLVVGTWTNIINKNNVARFLKLASFHPGALEIIGFLATGAYHLYLLWATHEDVIYQVNKSTMYFSDIYFKKCFA